MGHYERVMAEIDLDAVEMNFLSTKEHLLPTCKVCSVIKADGYGHGAIPIAKTLSALGVESFAVASSSEAMLLRRGGISQSLLVLGYTSEENFKDIVQHRITQSIFRLDMAEGLSLVASQLGMVAHIHLLLDTGMGRIGFIPNEETVQLVKRIKALPFLSLDGVFSHFARADEEDLSYSLKQLEKFNWFVDRLGEVGIHGLTRHLSNSAGMMVMPQAEFDMVRVGIATYGLYPSEQVPKDTLDLKPVLTLKSHLVFVKEVDAGVPISYGGTYVTDSPRIIATVPVGYGDGYPRALSSKGEVLIRGQRAPIVGRVCMDQFMVDVTHIQGVKNDDEVVLIGVSGSEQITVEDIATHMGTINYEVVCQLGKRIPRVYLKKGKPVMSIDYFH